MLYNLIESCVRSGFEEIYSAVKDSGKPYAEISEGLRDIWSNYEISKAHRDTANRQTYGRRVKEIIEQVISDNPLIITRDALDISGNLDARQIRELLNTHKISFTESEPKEKHKILMVNTKRNNLAHGDEAFGDCGRDYTLADLNEIKDQTYVFLNGLLDGMKKYYDDEGYLIPIHT